MLDFVRVSGFGPLRGAHGTGRMGVAPTRGKGAYDDCQCEGTRQQWPCDTHDTVSYGSVWHVHSLCSAAQDCRGWEPAEVLTLHELSGALGATSVVCGD